MSRLIDITGNRYWMLTVLEMVQPYKYPAKWLVKCDCGNVVEALGACMKRGTTQSCGCLQKKRSKKANTTHGCSTGGVITRLYNIWRGVKARCTNPNEPAYPEYGGRGVTLCDQWMKFEPFQEWALDNGYQETLSIDRNDNDLGYSPSNCSWENRVMQNRNRRPNKGSSSQYIGVSFNKASNKWRSGVSINKKYISIGVFSSELEAAIARDDYVKSNNLEGFTINIKPHVEQ